MKDPVILLRLNLMKVTADDAIQYKTEFYVHLAKLKSTVTDDYVIVTYSF